LQCGFSSKSAEKIMSSENLWDRWQRLTNMRMQADPYCFCLEGY
jgi:hypothetical protein